MLYNLVDKRHVLKVVLVQVSSTVVVMRVIMSQQHSQLRATYLSPASHTSTEPTQNFQCHVHLSCWDRGGGALAGLGRTRVDQETLQQCLQDSTGTNRDFVPVYSGDKLDKQHQCQLC